MIGLLVEVGPLVRMFTPLRAQMASQLSTSASYNQPDRGSGAAGVSLVCLCLNTLKK